MDKLVQHIKTDMPGIPKEGLYCYGEASFEANQAMQEPLEKLYKYENQPDMREKIRGYISELDKEIGKLYLNATTIVVCASLFICIPVEALCFKYILVYIGSMIEGHIPFYLPAWVYIGIILIGIVAYFAINTLHIKKINKISMSEALKNRE